MKLTIDERTKYRLTGVVVILSIMAIFLPAMMKKSNQRFEESLNLTMRLPEKPSLPDVNVPQSKEMFDTVKVAHVEIDPVVQAKETEELVKAEPLKQEQTIQEAAIVPVTQVSLQQPAPQEALASQIAKIPAKDKSFTTLSTRPAAAKLALAKPLPNKGVNAQIRYGIQVASFSQRHNAELLVNKLRGKGYQATYNKLSHKNGAFYQVIVGQIAQRDEAVHLQKKLAESVQLNGFIVKTGVS